MSNIHVLTHDGNLYKVVLHVAVPAGNNSAGMTWAAALAAAYKPASVLAAGDGTLGTISAVESAAVVAGTTLEIVSFFPQSSTFEGESGAVQLAQLDAWYSGITGTRITELQHQLQRYGGVFA